MSHKQSTVQARLVLLALILLLLIAACRNQPNGQGSDNNATATGQGIVQERPERTPTPSLTPLPSSTPTPTLTPTITPTPTPTAPPITLGGNPLALAQNGPTPQPGAFCGFVDYLDFPVDPPDAYRIPRGGQDFGRFRERYNGYHTGEDWWGESRRSSLGTPVHAIGHGQVTYAHPFGWGVDQGVIIIQHFFADGRSYLSFYGHLDPETVTLRHGECVTRGQHIADIGEPRGSPHLHFEIRNHTPNDPGPGYWGNDPRLSGWYPPSQTIWNERLAVSPGVLWLRPLVEQTLYGAGIWNGETMVALQDEAMIGLNITDGSIVWRNTFPEMPTPTPTATPQDAGDARGDDDDEEEVPEYIPQAALIDAVNPIVYTADRRGLISAFALPQDQPQEGAVAATTEAAHLWTLPLEDARGAPRLFPLPGGGVVLSVWDDLFAISADGALLWQHTFEDRPRESLLLEDQLLLSTPGQGTSLWSLDASGITPWDSAVVSGLPVRAGSQLFVYSGDGVYRLDPQTHSSELFFPLPSGLASQGDIIALPGGGLLVAHMDTAGRRLLALNEDGTLRWQRAYAGLLDGQPHLLNINDQIYLLSEGNGEAWGELSVYALDLENAALTWVFRAGTRTPLPGQTWSFLSQSGNLLLNIGGGNLLALNPSLALQELCNGDATLNCTP